MIFRKTRADEDREEEQARHRENFLIELEQELKSTGQYSGGRFKPMISKDEATHLIKDFGWDNALERMADVIRKESLSWD